MKKSTMPKMLRLVLVCLFLLVPSLAFAGSGPQTALQNFTDQVFAIMIPVLVAAVGTVGTWALFKLKAKLHIDVAQSTMDAWSQLAQNAAMRAGEWAHQKAKDLVGDKKIPGGDVMDVAVNWAIQMAEQQGLPDMAREKLVGLIEAELMKLRLAQQSPGEPLPAVKV